MMNKLMNPLSRLTLSVAFILACTASGFAQKTYCEVPPPSPFKHNALIVTRYDKPAKRMKVVLEHPFSLSRQGDALYLSASFFYADPRLRVRPMLSVAFISVSKEPKYRGAHNLSILTDGVRSPFAAPVQYRTAKGEHGFTQEVMQLSLSYDNLLDLIRARKVTASLGSTEFELTNNHLESLREIASLMVPQERNIILASRLGNRSARQVTNH
jgi:hypothetical protein